MAKRPARKTAAARKTPTSKRKRKPARRAEPSEPAPEVSAAAKVRRERSARALQLYEQGIDAMQRRNFSAADATLREVVADYPEERELRERARVYLRVCERESSPPVVYLRVCERESSPPVPQPQSLKERTYAATLALNRGSLDEAVRHLDAAAAEDPDSDHVQYMLAVTRALRGETDAAVAHLRRAIELNADNRLLAQQEPDFKALQADAAFRRVIEAPPAARRRSRNH